MVDINIGVIFEEIKTDNEDEIGSLIKEISKDSWVESLDLQVWWQIHGIWEKQVERPVVYNREDLLMAGVLWKT